MNSNTILQIVVVVIIVGFFSGIAVNTANGFTNFGLKLCSWAIALVIASSLIFLIPGIIEASEPQPEPYYIVYSYHDNDGVLQNASCRYESIDGNITFEEIEALREDIEHRPNCNGVTIISLTKMGDDDRFVQDSIVPTSMCYASDM